MQMQEFLYLYLFILVPMHNHIRGTSEQPQGQPNSHAPNHQPQQTIAAYLQHTQSSAHLTLANQEISKLKHQLQEREATIAGLEQRQQQLQRGLRQEKEDELRRKEDEWGAREKQILQHRRYIQQAETRRIQFYESVNKTILELKTKQLRSQRQLLESAAIARLNSQAALLEQEKNSLLGKLERAEQELASARQISEKKQAVIDSLTQELRSVKGEQEKKEAESEASRRMIQSTYQKLAQSHRKEKDSVQAALNQQINDLKANLRDKQQKLAEKIKQLEKRLESEAQLTNQRQVCQKQIQQLSYQLKKTDAELQRLRKAEQEVRLREQAGARGYEQKLRSVVQENKKLVEKETGEIRQAYEKKSSQLSLAFKNLEAALSSKFNDQKRLLQAEATSANRQLQNQNRLLLQANKTYDLNLKSVTAESKKSIDQLTGKLAKKQQELNKYAAILKQIRSILLKASIPATKNLSDEQLVAKLTQTLELTNQKEGRAKKAEEEAMSSLVLVVEVCGKNKMLLRTMEDKLKIKESIVHWKKVQEKPDDSNHLGLAINGLMNIIKGLILEKDQSIREKDELAKALRSQSNQVRKEGEVKSILLQELKKQLNALQSQNRTLSLAVQQEKFQRQRMQDSKEQSEEKTTRLQLELEQLRVNCQTARNTIEQQKCNVQEWKLKVQIDKASAQAEISKLRGELTALKSSLEVAQNHAKLQVENARSLNQNATLLADKIKTLQLTIDLQEAEAKRQKQESREKERILKAQLDQQIRGYFVKIGQALNSVFGSQPEIAHIDDITSFLQSNAGSSANTAFSVSAILQKMPRERSFLLDECCKFFGVNGLSTKLSFKYDEFCKNFANYLPTLQNKFLFAVVMKTKKNVVFGVVSYHIGRESKAFAFNLSSMKVMHKSPRSRVPATNYESSMLRFGNEELILRNNSSLDIRVNTMIIGERYFEFLKEDLVGKDEGDSVALEAMEIHRLIPL